MTLPSLGHVEVSQRCVDVLNATVDATSSADLGAAVRDVLERWGEEVGDDLEAALPGFRRVCGELRSLLHLTDRDAAAVALDGLLARSTTRPRLVHEAPHGWHLHVDPDDAAWDEWFAANSAIALATLLLDTNRVPWGVCAGAGCERLFLDHGRRGPQRYCSTGCATRARVRRHRARAATGERSGRPASGVR